jgi:hypothetical protein
VIGRTAHEMSARVNPNRCGLQGNRVNITDARFRPRVMAGLGPATHDFAWIRTISRGWRGYPHSRARSPCHDTEGEAFTRLP